MKTKFFKKSEYWIFRLLVIILTSLLSLSARSQVFPYLNFTGAALSSGTPLQQGAVYKFTNVTAGVDAFVTIQSLLNGATVANIDQFGAVGYDGAFQPIVNPAPGFPNSYARFLIVFKNTNGTSHSFANLATTGMDIDGTSMNMLEYCTIDMGGGTATYQSTSPEISISQIGTAYKAINISGNNVPGIDSTQKQVMFTVKKANVSSLTIDFGAVTTSPGNRNFSAFFGSFQYPAPIILPVKLYSFNAIMEKSNVELSWITEQEINASHFEVERSVNGKDYTSIAVVFAAGSSDTKVNYKYSDNIDDISSGVINYRLKMVDIDGKYTYSNIRVIHMSRKTEQSLAILTYPNPVSNELHITLPSTWQGKKVSFELMSNNGSSIISTESANSNQTETINVSKLATGFYILRVNCNNQTAQQKIIKQ
jgi:type IX secretion system substrate protein